MLPIVCLFLISHGVNCVTHCCVYSRKCVPAWCMCVCICVMKHVEARGQLYGDGCLLPLFRWFWESNPGGQAGTASTFTLWTITPKNTNLLLPISFWANIILYLTFNRLAFKFWYSGDKRVQNLFIHSKKTSSGNKTNIWVGESNENIIWYTEDRERQRPIKPWRKH